LHVHGSTIAAPKQGNKGDNHCYSNKHHTLALTHSLTHSPTHSLTHSLNHTTTHKHAGKAKEQMEQESTPHDREDQRTAQQHNTNSLLSASTWSSLNKYVGSMHKEKREEEERRLCIIASTHLSAVLELKETFVSVGNDESRSMAPPELLENMETKASTTFTPTSITHSTDSLTH